MSIASEIEDLATNLGRAKSAIITKGGTVGDTGLYGLASEIASIPGGGVVPENYGTVTYTDSGVTKTVVMEDDIDFHALCIGGSGTVVEINGVSVKKANITKVEITDGVNHLPDNFMNGCPNATSVVLPQSILFIGDSVFAGCGFNTGTVDLTNVVEIGNKFLMSASSMNVPIILSNVEDIGTEFLYGCSIFNNPISLPKVIKIGSYFMYNCAAFNSSITLGDKIQLIAERFMNGCASYAQSFTIPSSLLTDSTGVTYNPGSRFMHECKNFVGPLVCNTSTKIPTDIYALATTDSGATMYTTGVTLTGTYAQDWQTALPDRTSSPYRKLVIGS